MLIRRPLVVDANVAVGALLRDSANRHLITHDRFDLCTPADLWTELAKHMDMVQERSGLGGGALEALLRGLRKHIRDIPMGAVRAHMPEARRRLKGQDVDDAPYLAAALATDGAIWTHDKGLARHAGVQVLTTGDLVAMAGRR